MADPAKCGSRGVTRYRRRGRIFHDEGGLVRALAVELGRGGIQVNAILPGFIETEMSLLTSKDFQKACRRQSAIGRIGELKDMGGITVLLASSHSDFITGQSIVLDGGHTISRCRSSPSCGTPHTLAAVADERDGGREWQRDR